MKLKIFRDGLGSELEKFIPTVEIVKTKEMLIKRSAHVQAIYVFVYYNELEIKERG